MNARDKRIRILNLQDQYCKKCGYSLDPYQYCIQYCKIGKELIKLNKKVFGVPLERKETPEEKWDKRCKQAVDLYERGMEYPVIAKQIGCHVSGLYRELKKRGLLKVP
ncbi:TPA: helix-turn-helix domain-containing protein [Bacillus thuringiensis]|uniref:Cobalamin biosynthesis protein n=2 Tax=Bacillus cereus group TaxID=86661 RepID=A0A9X6QPD9_BACTU|nr:MULTISPECIES: helix-turn-helix domain-containing protein [Bacillus cereus group]HDR5353979.1 helix-turn-helix domain-containing protein [Bacillus thuringiensis]MEB9622495.1 helix-turn-helix domain-containing protein [Bacillus cereus]OUB44188.1 cobalamin biosynthesis protein [Bacillus thuringiensis serovar iberica]OUB45313.1 cobalamin biosynthesis protein [Bacillus thuringiensis serovar iberica]OUB48365.1 cobalamin biosynthesis protein [Bacillus thuringiensis serovar iberica]